MPTINQLIRQGRERDAIARNLQFIMDGDISKAAKYVWKGMLT